MRMFLTGTLLFVLVIISPNIYTQYILERTFPNLSFDQPIDLQNSADGTDRIFVVEMKGLIKVFENKQDIFAAKTFLDIQNKVLLTTRFGLLGLCFHPDYKNNGYLYIHYNANNPQRSVIARYKVSAANPDSVDPNSEFIIRVINQPHHFHNGGQLAFSPDDGYLYIILGDGGPGNDPNGEGQNKSTLLGSMLRVDVDSTSDSLNYSIPTDNPFIGNSEGWREEIWAYGLRNPWRFSFDSETGWLWAGENGENLSEQIEIIEKGKNYGWNTMEGSRCFNPPTGCDTSGLTLPIYEYGFDPFIRRSVIGGYVYRGTNNPSLYGKYIYTDWLRETIWSLEYDGVNPPINTVLHPGLLGFSSFGLDENDELYICNQANGNLYRFQPKVSPVESNIEELDKYMLEQNYPNPFNPTTSIQYTLRDRQFVSLKIYDVLGNERASLVNEEKPAGNYEAIFTPSYLSSGIYFYKLSSESFTETKKMILLK